MAVHVNIGRNRLRSIEGVPVVVSMGRAKEIGGGIMSVPGVELSVEPVAQPPIEAIQSPTPKDKLLKHGLIDNTGALTKTAFNALRSVGYNAEELASMSHEQLWNLRNSETGDIAFGGSPHELKQTKTDASAVNTPDAESKVSAEDIPPKTTVTLENLETFIEHIKNGGTFDSVGEDGARKLVQKPSGKYDIVDVNSGRVVAGNITEGRLRQSFEGRLRDFPGKFSY